MLSSSDVSISPLHAEMNLFRKSITASFLQGSEKTEKEVVMSRLSSLIENLRSHYSVVVIGSGYGGAIAASRLARAGQQVCVLQRGLEFQPGEYPDTLPEVLAQTQVDTPDAFLGCRTGLYDMRINDDINVFCGCGLGGTSSVNANVSLPAEPRVFDDPRWPEEFRADIATRLQTGYKLAQEMLAPSPYP